MSDTRPDYRFSRDRQHWIFVGVADSGFPIQGSLHLIRGASDPQLVGPEQWWRAEDVPRLYVRAAFRTRGDRAEIFWSVPDGGFSAERRLAFPVKPDGEFHTYEIDLGTVPGYRGTITGLRLDPTDSIAAGEEVRIEFLSWKPN